MLVFGFVPGCPWCKTLREESFVDPKFVELQKDLEEAKKNRGTVKIADLRKRSEEDKKKVDAEKKKLAEHFPHVQVRPEYLRVVGESEARA